MVTTQPVPHVPEDQRVVVRPLGHGVSDVVVRYGFMEDPNVPDALARAQGAGPRDGPWTTSPIFSGAKP